MTALALPPPPPLLYCAPLAQTMPLLIVNVPVTVTLARVVPKDDAALALNAIAGAEGTPPVVATVLTVPVGPITTPVGFGLLVVGNGINAIAPVAASVLIVAPPRSMVLPLRYSPANLCVGVPRL